MMRNLKSKKFVITLAVIIGIFITVNFGELNAESGIASIVAVTGSYLTVNHAQSKSGEEKRDGDENGRNS